MPAISTTRCSCSSPQRLGEVRGLALQHFVRGEQPAHLLAQADVGLQPRLLHLAHLQVELAERFLHRLHQLVDGELPFFEVGAGAFLKFFQGGAGEAEEGLVVASQRVGGKRLEGVRKPRLGVEEHRLFFHRRLAFLLQPRPQGGQLLLQGRGLALRDPAERKLVGKPSLQFRRANFAGVEPLLQCRHFRPQDQPGGQRRQDRRGDEAPNKFHAPS
jgi:hypothetical protein